MIEVEPIVKDLTEQLQKINFSKGDLSDIGNEIGIALGKYISDEMGFEYEDFLAGIRHGISLAKGTH